MKSDKLINSNEKIIPPKITDPIEEAADWVEWCSLVEPDENVSFDQLVSVMRMGGSVDAVSEPDEYDYPETVEERTDLEEAVLDSDKYEASAESVFYELNDRFYSCGEKNYPFNITKGSVTTKNEIYNSPYLFMLLLTKYGHDAGPSNIDGSKLFEELCATALKNYLNNETSRSLVFGFPRRLTADGFKPALDRVSLDLGEGDGSTSRPTSNDQKDAKLDIVAWKPFLDDRKGKLIIFGQCATGDNWKEKRSELIAPSDWCRLWLRDTPAVLPIKSFFVPHRIGEKDWFESCVYAGILFDRCRISNYAIGLESRLVRDINRWSKYIIKNNTKSMR